VTGIGSNYPEDQRVSILRKFSSTVGERSEASNRMVAGMCIENPDLLGEIAEGLETGSDVIKGDCAEVMTMVAKDEPEFVVPYVGSLMPLVDHPKARIRWEAIHAVSLVAGFAPHFLRKLLPRLDEIIQNDTSIIARDCAVRAIGNYAGTGKTAAQEAYPILIQAIPVRDYRHAHLAINGLMKVLEYMPDKKSELENIGEQFMESSRGVLKKAAKKLLKALDSMSE